MTHEEKNKMGHSCCDTMRSMEISVCKERGNKGKPVKEITLKSIVKASKLENLKNLEGFYFCETPTCKVVYYNNDQNIYVYREEVK